MNIRGGERTAAGLITGPTSANRRQCQRFPLASLARLPCPALPCLACHNMPALLPSCLLFAARLASSSPPSQCTQVKRPGVEPNLAHLYYIWSLYVRYYDVATYNAANGGVLLRPAFCTLRGIP